MLKGVQAPRDPSGCCGVPAGYSQTHNCALGWLVISDVMAALHQVGSSVPVWQCYCLGCVSKRLDARLAAFHVP